MESNEVFELIKKNLKEILVDIETDSIKITDSLRDLGANSVDRADILMSTMEDLGVQLPMVKFGKAKNIEDIVAVFLASEDE